MNRTVAIAELMSVMGSLKRSLQGKTYSCLDGTKLTSGQLGLLFAIKHHGPISAQELATKLTMTPGGVSQIVDSLLEEGFLARTPRESDRRMLDLTLSEHGLAQVSDIERERHALLAHSTQSLSDIELKQLVSSLQAIVHAIQTDKP